MAAADSHEKQDHLTGRELSARAQEHPQKAHQEALMDHHHDNPGGTFGHDDIATLPNQLWQARGCPPGSPDQDWFHATKQLRAHALSLKQARRI